YCKIDGKEDIPVGGEDYDDETCARTTCEEGYYERQGCDIEEAVVDQQCNWVKKVWKLPHLLRGRLCLQQLKRKEGSGVRMSKRIN
ncbi:hypothetical protein AVEN_60875-1, partial [Araneus ventricosus]